MFLPFLYLIPSLPHLAQAASASAGQSCSQANNRLQAGSYQFTGDCDSQTYCGSDNTCAYKGCRKDIFPFGYGVDDELPPRRLTMKTSTLDDELHAGGRG